MAVRGSSLADTALHKTVYGRSAYDLPPLASDSDPVGHMACQAKTAMTISPDVVRSVLDQSLDRFFVEEVKPLLDGVNERSNCTRLAIIMTEIAGAHGLRAYFVDTEYNRMRNGQVKTILDGKTKVVTINCDLILHSRGNLVAEDNLIAVEMKKSEGTLSQKQRDRDRLSALTKVTFDDVWTKDGVTQPAHVCGYVLGAYVEIHRTRRHYVVEYYAEGHRIEEVKRTF